VSCCDHWHCDPVLAPHNCDAPKRQYPCPECGAEPFIRGRRYEVGDRVTASADASFGKFMFRGTVKKVLNQTESGRQLVEVHYDEQFGTKPFLGVEWADDLRPLDVVARIGELEVA